MDSSHVFGGSMILLFLLSVVCLVLWVFIMCLILSFACLWIGNSQSYLRFSLMFMQFNIICCRLLHTLNESGIPQTRGINSASGLIMSCISELFRTPSERTMVMSIPKERLCFISIPMGSGVVAVLADVGHYNTYYATFQIM